MQLACRSLAAGRQDCSCGEKPLIGSGFLIRYVFVLGSKRVALAARAAGVDNNLCPPSLQIMPRGNYAPLASPNLLSTHCESKMGTDARRRVAMGRLVVRR